jgi:hypothetical protein
LSSISGQLAIVGKKSGKLAPWMAQHPQSLVSIFPGFIDTSFPYVDHVDTFGHPIRKENGNSYLVDPVIRSYGLGAQRR